MFGELNETGADIGAVMMKVKKIHILCINCNVSVDPTSIKEPAQPDIQIAYNSKFDFNRN